MPPVAVVAGINGSVIKGAFGVIAPSEVGCNGGGGQAGLRAGQAVFAPQHFYKAKHPSGGFEVAFLFVGGDAVFAEQAAKTVAAYYQPVLVSCSYYHWGCLGFGSGLFRCCMAQGFLDAVWLKAF